MERVSFSIALIAGIVSFLSPCVLPLLPSYLSFITGMSVDELTQRANDPATRRLTLIHSLMFILGFSLVFILLGASASVAGKILLNYQIWISRIGGAFIIVLGLQFTGLINLHLLQRERKVRFKRKPVGYLGSTLVGIAFAAGAGLPVSVQYSLRSSSMLPAVARFRLALGSWQYIRRGLPFRSSWLPGV